jgi:hypothetical protein
MLRGGRQKFLERHVGGFAALLQDLFQHGIAV